MEAMKAAVAHRVRPPRPGQAVPKHSNQQLYEILRVRPPSPAPLTHHWPQTPFLSLPASGSARCKALPCPPCMGGAGVANWCSVVTEHPPSLPATQPVQANLGLFAYWSVRGQGRDRGNPETHNPEIPAT